MENDPRTSGTKFECRKIGMRHTRDGHVFYMAIQPEDTPEELLADYLGQRYVAVLVRIDDDETVTLSKKTAEADAAVKTAGAMCRDERFQNWLLFTQKIDDASEEAAIDYVRKLCGIASRSELKVDKVARQRFFGLQEEFAAHLRSGGRL